MRLKSRATLSQYCDFLAGFFPSAGYFFTFYLICIASMILMSAVYRLLAAASPNMDIASATGAAQSKPRLLLPLTNGLCLLSAAIPQLSCSTRASAWASSYPYLQLQG